MTSSFFSKAVLLLCSVHIAASTIISPKKDESWELSKGHEIKWDTAGLEAPLKMHLAPGGAIDLSTIISELNPSAPNSGSWTWYPQTSIPQHETFIIIIVDHGGKSVYGNPFKMYGWEKQTVVHTSTSLAHTIAAPAYTTPPVIHNTVVITEIHSSAAAVVTEPPIIHNTIIITEIHSSTAEAVAVTKQTEVVVETAVVHTSVLIHTPPPIAQTEVIAVTKTSVFEHVSAVVVTSALAPIIKTIEVPPVIQTHQVAPILSTEILAPLIKTVSQAPIWTTEFQQPIVKTILVTETPPPIIKSVFVAPLLVTESQAPLIITQTQAPVISTILQAPHLVTEIPAPLLITEQLTQQFTTAIVSQAIEIIESHPGAISVTELITEHVKATLTTEVVVHETAPPVHNTIIITEIHSSAAAVHTPPPVHSFSSIASAEPLFQNTTSVEIVASSLTTFSSIPAQTTFAPLETSTSTRATALAQSGFSTSFTMGSASGTGVGAQPATFTGAASKKTAISGGLWAMLGGMAMLIM